MSFSGAWRGWACSTYRLSSQRARQPPVALHHAVLPLVEGVSGRLCAGGARVSYAGHISGRLREDKACCTLPSLVRRLAAEKPVPVTANMTVNRPVCARGRKRSDFFFGSCAVLVRSHVGRTEGDQSLVRNRLWGFIIEVSVSRVVRE